MNYDIMTIKLNLLLINSTIIIYSGSMLGTELLVGKLNRPTLSVSLILNGKKNVTRFTRMISFQRYRAQ